MTSRPLGFPKQSKTNSVLHLICIKKSDVKWVLQNHITKKKTVLFLHTAFMNAARVGNRIFAHTKLHFISVDKNIDFFSAPGDNDMVLQVSINEPHSSSVQSISSLYSQNNTQNDSNFAFLSGP